jgi:hypothetical protein
MTRREMQARVALVIVFRIAQALGVVAHDALDESEVIEYDGSAQSALYVNPRAVRIQKVEWRGICYMATAAEHGFAPSAQA